MILGLCLIAVTLLGWTVVGVATRPAGRGRVRRREAERRSHQLHVNPDRVSRFDVENLLLAESVPLSAVARVMDRSAARRMSARTMWRWARVHGSAQLVAVVDAGLAEDTLLDHLDAGTAPDPASLEVFARLARDTVPVLPAVPSAPDVAGLMSDPEPISLDGAPWPVDPVLVAGLEGLVDWGSRSADPVELQMFDRLPPIAEPGLTPRRGLDGGWPAFG